MVRHTLKILQHLLQDFYSVPDHFGTLCIKGLKLVHEQVVNKPFCSNQCNSTVFERSNGLMIKCLIVCLMN